MSIKITNTTDLKIIEQETTFKKKSPKIKRISPFERNQLLEDFETFRDEVHQDVINDLVYH